MKYDYFISYSHVDIEHAEWLKETLLDEGHKVYLADRLPPDRSISEELGSRLAESNVLLLVLTKHALDSSWVNQEVVAMWHRHPLSTAVVVISFEEVSKDALREQKGVWFFLASRPSVSLYDLLLDDRKTRLVEHLAEVAPVRPPPPRAGILVIYDWEDRRTVRKLVEGLRAADLETAWDQDWAYYEPRLPMLRHAIERSLQVLVFYSDSVRDSPRVASDIKLVEAADRQVGVILHETAAPDDKFQQGIPTRAMPPLNAAGIAELQAFLRARPVVMDPDTRAEEPAELIRQTWAANLDLPFDVVGDRLCLSSHTAALAQRASSAAHSTLQPQDPLRVEASLLWAQVLRFRGEWKEAMDHLRDELDYIREALPDSPPPAELELEFQSLQYESGRRGAVGRVEEMLSEINERDDIVLHVKMRRQLGNMYKELGKWPEARKHLEHAEALAEWHSLVGPGKSEAARVIWADCLLELGALHQDEHDFESAHRELARAFDAVEDCARGASEYIRGVLLYRRGSLHLAEGELHEAANDWSESESILTRYDNPVRLTHVTDALGRLDLASSFPSDDQVASAKRRFEKSLRIRKALQHKYMMGWSYMNLADLDRSAGRFEPARAHYQAAVSLFNELGKKADQARAGASQGLLLVGAATEDHPEAKEKGLELLKRARVELQEVGLDDLAREVEFQQRHVELGVDLPPEALEDGDYLTVIGEYSFHRWIGEHLKTERSDHVIVGVGDDAAVLRVSEDDKLDLVVTTDAAPGSICASSDHEMGEYAGIFSVVHTVSDLLATGARPIALLLNLHLRRDVTFGYARRVVEAVQRVGRQYGATLIGGDVKERDHQSVGCTAIGVVDRGQQLLRSAAEKGHVLGMTLAGVGGERRLIGARWAQEVLEHHDLEREPRFERLWAPEKKKALLALPYEEMLVAIGGSYLRAAIDTSDGFLSCLKLMGRESNVGFRVEEELVVDHIDHAAKELAKTLAVRPIQFLFNAGHDWEIVFTTSRENFEGLRAELKEKNAVGTVIQVGEVVERRDQDDRGIELVLTDGDTALVPYFTDEKFVPEPYAQRANAWLDLRRHIPPNRD